MARANCRYHPCASAEHHQNADPNDGSHDGCLGGADQITDDQFAIGDTVEARVLTRRQPGRQLAKRKRVGSDEPHAVLDAMGGTVAESLDRRDGVLDPGRQATWWRRIAPPLNLKSCCGARLKSCACSRWPSRFNGR